MFNKIWLWVLSVLSILTGAFLWEKNKREEAEAQLASSKYNLDSAVLQTKLDNLTKDQQAQIVIAEVEKGRKLTTQEMEDFLNNL